MISGLGGIAGVTATAVTERPKAQGAAAADQPFGAVLGDMLDHTVSQLKGAEQLSMKALQGEADTRTVVDAVMSAEQSLQAAIAIRDKIVNAYLDISRMAI